MLNFTNTFNVASKGEGRSKEKRYLNFIATPVADSPAKTTDLAEVEHLPLKDDSTEARKKTLSNARTQISYEQGDNVNHLSLSSNPLEIGRIQSLDSSPFSGTAIHFSKMRANVGISRGFAICSFIPTVRADCTSSAKAFAVMAMMGTLLQ